MIATAETEVGSGVRRVVHAATTLQRDYPVAQMLALAALFAVGAATIDGFTSVFSIRAMLILSSLLGISALGQTVCLLIGGIDVSIAGWVLAGATVTATLLGGTGTRWATWQVFLVLAAGSILIGGLIGLLCYRFNVPALVVTLASGAMIQGGILAWSPSGNGIPPHWLAEATSPASRTFGLGMPPVVFIWALIALGAYVVLQRSVVGPWVQATGSNPRAARLALLPTHWVWAGAFALSALAATTAGVLLSGFAAGGDASIGTPYLWNGLTAVLIGGTAFGSHGDYTRTVIGSLFVVVLSQVMTGYGLGYADQNILFGALIVLIVSLYRRDRRLRDRI